MVEDFERLKAARLHREEEQRVFQQAMNEPQQPPTKIRRMQVDVAVGLTGSTSMIKPQVPAMNATPAATITLALRLVESENGVVGDEATALMQTKAGKVVSGQQCKLQQLLQGVHPQLRGKIVVRVRELLGVRPRQLLMQGIQMVGTLHSGLLGDEGEGADSDADVISDKAWARMAVVSGSGVLPPGLRRMRRALSRRSL